MSAYSERQRYYLRQIVDNIRLAQAFIAQMTLDDFVADTKTRYACERAVLYVSEAIRDFEKEGRKADPEFTLDYLSGDVAWSAGKGIGNVIRHDYDEIREEVIWNTIIDRLPHLASVCQEALDAPEKSGD